MKPLFAILFLVMAVGGLLGLAIEESPGYVQIRYEGFLLETSFWFFLLVLVCSVLVLFALSSAFRKLLIAGDQVIERRSLKTERLLSQKRDTAMSAMIECRWEEANILFTEVANQSEAPLVFLLLAARSAHNLGLAEHRDSLLQTAQSLSKESKKTVSYLKAEFYIEDGKHREAANILTDIRIQEELPEIWLEKLLECYEILGEEGKVEALVSEVK